MSGDTLVLKERLAEAARYALLRRLAPAIRHNMAGSLQPIGMISAMLERRLQAAAPDFGKLGKNASDISELSRQAASACMNLMTWLAPRERDLVPLNSGLTEALQLLATELSFRGFTLVNETTDLDTQVNRGTLRSLAMASLIALTDATAGPARVVLSTQRLEGQTMLRIELAATEDDMVPNSLKAYRQLGWDDVQALADAEGIALLHADNRVELRFRAADAQNS
jgi:hypothetical protein